MPKRIDRDLGKEAARAVMLGQGPRSSSGPGELALAATDCSNVPPTAPPDVQTLRRVCANGFPATSVGTMRGDGVWASGSAVHERFVLTTAQFFGRARNPSFMPGFMGQIIPPPSFAVRAYVAPTAFPGEGADWNYALGITDRSMAPVLTPLAVHTNYVPTQEEGDYILGYGYPSGVDGGNALCEDRGFLRRVKPTDSRIAVRSSFARSPGSFGSADGGPLLNYQNAVIGVMATTDLKTLVLSPRLFGGKYRKTFEELFVLADRFIWTVDYNLHPIYFNDLIQKKQLWDHDEIGITEEASSIGADSVAIELKIVRPVRWWKAIYLNENKLQSQSGDNLPLSPVIVPLASIRAGHLVLWKGKGVGETRMYEVVDSFTKMKGGYKYTFRWLKD